MTRISTPPTIKGLGDVQIFLEILANKKKLEETLGVFQSYIDQANKVYSDYASIEEAKNAIAKVRADLDKEAKTTAETLAGHLSNAQDTLAKAKEELAKAEARRIEVAELEASYKRKIAGLAAREEAAEASHSKLVKEAEELNLLRSALEQKDMALRAQEKKIQETLKSLTGGK